MTYIILDNKVFIPNIYNRLHECREQAWETNVSLTFWQFVCAQKQNLDHYIYILLNKDCFCLHYEISWTLNITKYHDLFILAHLSRFVSFVLWLHINVLRCPEDAVTTGRLWQGAARYTGPHLGICWWEPTWRTSWSSTSDPEITNIHICQ